MQIRELASDYSVSPQIAPEDLAAVAAAGFKTVLCNRPDAEVPPELSAAAIRAAAEAVGLHFVENPVTHQTLTAEVVAAQSAAMADAGGPVLAYCASGTRSTILWSLGQAGQLPADEIITRAARAGYDMEGLRARLSGG
ncbi:MAG: TIGR01244 family phosphatase [Rubellimicrobium sp.]|nr:TIGR01244 family phosphatase [Rubellimicrobium sp.]